MTTHLAIDIGGTFVDAIEFDLENASIQAAKASTTPRDPIEGVFDAITRGEMTVKESVEFIHGTTLGLNAFLEREGAKTGIITNEGMRDIFEVGRYNVEDGETYNILYEKPELLVPRNLRVGVPGRLDIEGDEVTGLNQASVQAAADYLVSDHNVESIAICFLHSYANPAHERKAREIITAKYPDVNVSLSNNVSGEYREYERTATTVIDAYIRPIFDQYISKIDNRLKSHGFDGSFFVTRSGGGSMTAESASNAPVQTIFSGPAGGLIGSAHVGDFTNRKNLIAADMGGTSFDTCVIHDGSPAIEYEATLGHLPIMIPVYDIRTIGAGGGSKAWIDGNRLRVGPESAGADPGPICYGQGGTDPTVTDAALLLGYLDPDQFLGGEKGLLKEKASELMESELAMKLGSSVTDVSRGIIEVTLAGAISALREITVEKGLDPRQFSIIAYGGAGPMFLPMLAREMDIPEVIIPQTPGVFSAWGMLMSDVVYDLSQTNVSTLTNLPRQEYDDTFTALEVDASDRLKAEGFGSNQLELTRKLEMRYQGQEHTVEVSADNLDSLDELSERFQTEHEQRYGHTMDDPPEIVHFRIRAKGITDKPGLDQLPDRDSGEPEPITNRVGFDTASNRIVDYDVFNRNELLAGDQIAGPTIIQEETSTTVIHSDQFASVDEYGHLIIERKE